MSSYDDDDDGDDDDDDDDDDGDDLNLLLKSGDNLFLANPKSPLRGFSGNFFVFKSSSNADCQGFFALFASPLILSQTSDITFSFPFLFW